MFYYCVSVHTIWRRRMPIFSLVQSNFSHILLSMHSRQYTSKLCMRFKTVMKMWKGSIIMANRHVHVADLSLPQFHWSGISEKCIIWQFFDCVVAGVGAIIWYVIFCKWSERAAGMQLFSKVVWHEYWHFIRYI